MKIVEKLQELSAEFPRKVKAAKGNEANTREFLIKPFFQALGYDTSDPDDVGAEFTADIERYLDKVDYVIKRNGNPIILVEFKAASVALSRKYTAQLQRYFSSKLDIRFGILTNGIEYRFYADLERLNVMDDEPFMTLDLLDFDESLIDCLSLFTKSGFQKDEAVDAARASKDRLKIRQVLQAELNPLSDGLVSYFVSQISPGRMPGYRREELTKLIRRTWQEFLNSKSQRNVGLPTTIQPARIHEGTKQATAPMTLASSGDSVPIPVHIHYRPRGSRQKYVLNGTLHLTENIGRNQNIVEYDGELLPPSEAGGRAIRSVNPGVSNPNGWVYWTFVNPNTGKDEIIDVLTKDADLQMQLLRGDRK